MNKIALVNFLLVPLLLASCAQTPSSPPYRGQTAYLNSGGNPHAIAAPAAPNYYQAPASPQPSQSYAPPPPLPQSPAYQQGYAMPAVYRPQEAAAYSAEPVRQSLASPSNVAPDAPWIHAQSYILVNMNTGRVLAARNADSVRGAASTQKILTALIVAEAGNLDKLVRIQASDVAVEPSKLGVRPGEVYTRRQLLIAFLVKSSNDVANALARDNAGSISAFSAKMNARARSLGARHSQFRNPHGLTASGQYSTARDLATIAVAAYRHPIVRDAIRRKYYRFTYNTGRVATLENTNELLGRMPECDGMKTGYTNAAGRCLMSCAHSRGRGVMLVQLGTKTKYIWNDGERLMRWGLSRS